MTAVPEWPGPAFYLFLVLIAWAWGFPGLGGQAGVGRRLRRTCVQMQSRLQFIHVVFTSTGIVFPMRPESPYRAACKHIERIEVELSHGLAALESPHASAVQLANRLMAKEPTLVVNPAKTIV